MCSWFHTQHCNREIHMATLWKMFFHFLGNVDGMQTATRLISIQSNVYNIQERWCTHCLLHPLTHSSSREVNVWGRRKRRTGSLRDINPNIPSQYIDQPMTLIPYLGSLFLNNQTGLPPQSPNRYVFFFIFLLLLLKTNSMDVGMTKSKT